MLTPASASGFDPLNRQDSGNENTAQAHYVLNGTGGNWSTQDYTTAYFGRIKAGVGLILDMGKAVQVKTVKVQFGTAPGAIVKIEVGNSNDRTAANLGSMQTVAGPFSVSGSTTFTITHPASGRYLVIWFTKLPLDPKPFKPQYPYAAQVYSVSVQGIG